jgi:uncharacterized membrane protein YsdA (DUF1294 family)
MFIVKNIGKHIRLICFGFTLDDFGIGFRAHRINHKTKKNNYKVFIMEFYLLFFRIFIDIYNKDIDLDDM